MDLALLAMATPSLLPGITEYVKKLEKIAQDCGDKLVTREAALEKDEFLKVKKRVYVLLEETRETIHERSSLLKRRGNCHETITKANTIRQNLDELKRAMPKLQELHKKAQNKRGASRQKEELQARYKDIRVLKRHVDEVTDLFASTSGGAENHSERLFGNREDATVLGNARAEDTKRSLTAEEEDALATMKKRDLEIDKQVGDIGLIIDRLDPLARQIGITAEQQRLKAEAITGDVEKADQDLLAMNKRIEEVMKYEKNTNCFCQLCLLMVLLCCVGYVFQQLNL